MTTLLHAAGAATRDNGKSTPMLHDNDHSDLMRIGELARQFDITMRTLRFYEDKGLLTPKRVGNTRLYSKRDVVRLKLILRGRKVGFSLRDVKQIIDLYEPEGSNIRQMKVTLEKCERQLERLHAQRQAIGEAIDEMEDILDTVRDGLSKASPAAN